MYFLPGLRTTRLSLLATMSVLCIFSTVAAVPNVSAHTIKPAVTAKVTGVPVTGLLTRIATSIVPITGKATRAKVVLKGPDSSSTSPAPISALPKVTDPQEKPEGTLLHNLNGLNDLNQAVLNGGVGPGAITPPDQGLCVGKDPRVPQKEVVFELVNDAARETAPNGSALPGSPLLGNRDVNLKTLFQDPGASGDVRCFYDQSTRTFFFIEFGVPQRGPFAGRTDLRATDIAVYNARGYSAYQLDQSLGGRFFADQPHVGFDNNNLYISTDQFAPGGVAPFSGVTLFAISKSQLVAEIASPATVSFGLLSLGGKTFKGLEPAISTTPTNTEYLLNSFQDATDNQLGLWTVINGAGVRNGTPVILLGTIIQSELYALPVPAVSTGTGITTNGITSEAALAQGDSRMLQVQFVSGHLWGALTTAITITGDTAVRDGAAWFEVNPKLASVTDQGYIASIGRYLIYPAILHTVEGTTAIAFTLTSATVNPSAAYVVRKSNAKSFGSVQIAALGNGPHLSFSDTTDGKRPRWGDYSAAALDTNKDDIWLATEYIPPVSDPFDNWGTRVFDVMGDH